MMTDSPDYHLQLDPDLRQAAVQAQRTFKHFWYQVSTDFNRIVPALGMAIVKAPFSDDFSDPESQVEHMWIEGIYFDGLMVSGTLLNSPHHLTSVSEGDSISLPLDRIEDWLLCMDDDDAYGGFSVQVIRSRMNDDERREHDEAWGLNFPAPDHVNLPQPSEEFEQSITEMMKEQIQEEPDCLSEDYGEGRTMLHLMSLFGRATAVQALLDAGADTSRKCERGWTAEDYARAAGWDDIASMLASS